MVQDLVHNLCESLVENIGGVADTGKRTPPTPITYLTQWKLMGNSVVHTDEYLTSWKVEGNSVVDNNAILSCGDLGQDGKYHVKISNGVTIYDIPLTEPLRKVNDVADNIEFANGSAVLTRKIAATKISDNSWSSPGSSQGAALGFYTDVSSKASGYVLLCAGYNTITEGDFYWDRPNLSIGSSSVYTHRIYIKDLQYTTLEEFLQGQGNKIILYELETPTTEVIQAPPFPISPTDTYTSVNDTPYSAFEYKKNVEIWSCGEYSEVDNKWHIRILPEGYGVVDIALDEPLRKVGDVADTIEFADGVTTVTRKTSSIDLGNCTYYSKVNGFYSDNVQNFALKPASGYSMDVLCAAYPNAERPWTAGCMGISLSGSIWIGDTSYESVTAIKNALAGVEMIYKLETPTTETIQVPQIQEADSYTCVISQGGKAVEWSSFETE